MDSSVFELHRSSPSLLLPKMIAPVPASAADTVASSQSAAGNRYMSGGEIRFSGAVMEALEKPRLVW